MSDQKLADDRNATTEAPAEDHAPDPPDATPPDESERDYRDPPWPEPFKQFLAAVPDLDQELSDIISEMMGLRGIADTALLIYMNASEVPKEGKPGKLDYHRARMISPMREEVANFVWQLSTRIDAYYDRIQDYQYEAQEAVMQLARELENGGGAAAPDDAKGNASGESDAETAALLEQAAMTLAIAEYATSDLTTSLNEDACDALRDVLASTRHTAERHLGIDGHESDARLPRARKRWEELLREEGGAK